MKRNILFVLSIIVIFITIFIIVLDLFPFLELKIHNIEIEGVISRVYSSGYKNNKFKIEYTYYLDNKKYHSSSRMSLNPIEKWRANTNFTSYYSGKKIELLVNTDNLLIHPKENINSKIMNSVVIIVVLTLFLLFLISFLITEIYNKTINKRKQNKYDFYVQSNNYKVKNIIYFKNKNDLKRYDITKYINELNSQKILCFGFNIGCFFIEIYKMNNNYMMRTGSEDVENQISNLEKHDLADLIRKQVQDISVL